MDIIAISHIVIIALIAIFFPFMTLTGLQLKRYLLITAALIAAPLAIAFIGNLLGWFSVNYVHAILLERGIFSISFATAYGIIAGLLLYAIKVGIVSLFKRTTRA